MSHVRFGYALACLGILITTGGCAESATAPNAASVEASANRFTNPATADDAAGNPAKPASPTETSGDQVYTTSSGLLNGGGRSADTP
jgi:hypothetical protein